MSQKIEEKLGLSIETLIRNATRLRLQRGKPFGLRGLEVGVLDTLLKRENMGEANGTNPSRISGEMGVQGPVISPVLASLEKKGYICRRQDENDRRCNCISLTRQGSDIAARIRQDRQQINSRLAQYLGEDDAREFDRLLQKLSGFLETEQNHLRFRGEGEV